MTLNSFVLFHVMSAMGLAPEVSSNFQRTVAFRRFVKQQRLNEY